MGKVLFLSGGENKYYDNQRSLILSVDNRVLFKKNTFFGKISRRIMFYIFPDFIFLFFNNWKSLLEKYDFIILPVSIYSIAVLKFIRRKSKVVVVNWYWNPVHTTIMPDLIKFPRSLTLSFDMNDCKKYGLIFLDTYYFKRIVLPCRTIEYDAVFIGADKGRLYKLLDLKSQLEKSGLRVCFYITSKDTLRSDPNYAYSPWISYELILEYIARSKVIIDFVQEGQAGLSQRPMESIFFGKKLITNDVSITERKFYDKRNVFLYGCDDFSSINKFISEPYKRCSDRMVAKYDFSVWIEQVREIKNKHF